LLPFFDISRRFANVGSIGKSVKASAGRNGHREEEISEDNEMAAKAASISAIMAA
jgi:hypothetical protein